ncbi:MAG: GPI inositol-deacylase [Gammaproteobacteria bacterium]|nr:GPI inositol-deacylase [Gammaproteobacteria bacterium]
MNRSPSPSWPIRRIAAASISCLAFLVPGAAFAAAGSVTLSDPVPTLLDGPQITTNANRLAAGARPVEGVAADGVSRIVVAVTADAPGQQFTFTIFNDQLAPSASTAEDGGLALPGAAGAVQSQVGTSAVATGQGPMAFVVYRAPLDFARAGDGAASERAVSIHWTIAGSSASGAIPITILRPPLVLIHGLWSNPATWDHFTPLIGDPRFAIFRANYNTLEVPLLISGSSATPVPANGLGFAFNARYVAPQIESFVHSFKTGRNPASLPVAAVQADIVAHSMGGDITRTMPLAPGFASATSFGQGNVHKLITIDTPHLGTPLAKAMLDKANGCLYFAFLMEGFYILPSPVTTEDGRSIGGAMGDLIGDGAGGGLSPALQAMQAPPPQMHTAPIPTAFVAAIAGPDQLGGLDYCHAHYQDNPVPKQCANYARIVKACGGNPLVKNMVSGADWKSNVMGGESDALVPFPSEINNASPAPGALTAIHSASLELLGLGGPGVLQPAAGAPERVIALLNTWITDAAFVGLR